MARKSRKRDSISRSTSTPTPTSISTSASDAVQTTPSTATTNGPASTPAVTAVGVDKSSAAYLKRREQVRRAQRTHRVRKETYIHALESEVLALRTRVRDVEERNTQLRVQLHGARGGAWEGLIEKKGRDNGLLDVEADYASWETTPLDALTLTSGDVVGGEEEVVREPRVEKSWTLAVEYADVAMEFVLTCAGDSLPLRRTASADHVRLEKPCIQRAQSAVFDPLNAYPPHQSSSRTELATYHAFVEKEFLTTQTADIASSLENLLTLSSAFCLEDEVTPVQAWTQLCGYFELGMLSSKGLRGLVDALLEHVRCYGSVISLSIGVLFYMLTDAVSVQ